MEKVNKTNTDSKCHQGPCMMKCRNLFQAKLSLPCTMPNSCEWPMENQNYPMVSPLHETLGVAFSLEACRVRRSGKTVFVLHTVACMVEKEETWLQQSCVVWSGILSSETGCCELAWSICCVGFINKTNYLFQSIPLKGVVSRTVHPNSFRLEKNPGKNTALAKRS